MIKLNNEIIWLYFVNDLLFLSFCRSHKVKTGTAIGAVVNFVENLKKRKLQIIPNMDVC
jgi:hypothetical protein